MFTNEINLAREIFLQLRTTWSFGADSETQTSSNVKRLTTKVVGLDDTFDLDMWNDQFGSRSWEIWPLKSLLRSQSEIRTYYLPRSIWRSYLRFQGKQRIPKLEEISCHTTRTPNLHYLESGRGRYGVGKAELQNRKVWTRLILWKPSFLLSQGRSHARKGGARPKAPQGYKYNRLGTQGGVIKTSIHQRAADMKEKCQEEVDDRRKSSNCLGDSLGRALAAMVGPAWWSHGGVPEPQLEFVESFVPSTFDGDINQFLSLLLSTTSSTYSYLRTMCGSTTGGWSLPCVMSYWQCCVD
jgi:hypothetical protein